MKEGKHVTSCFARLFWMAKPIIINATFMDLGDDITIGPLIL